MAERQSQLRWESYGHQLAENIRELRKRRGLSQEELAELANLSRNQISNLERNDHNGIGTANPTLSTIYQIARGLGVMPIVVLPGAVHEVADVCTDAGLDRPMQFRWYGIDVEFPSDDSEDTQAALSAAQEELDNLAAEPISLLGTRQLPPKYPHSP
ncbi:helix-turn-helix domain-containing protein [Corynebacterium sp. 3HC-13]|uniref:helix-turn-helix domain-containing protein n=1 Tax=Corynebacterium poyangense TaxID=2684405 RepID=UPI00165CF9D4|nr:helix-turn-helix transcriptional regulator [Corynebacterium poyangense]MBZ8176820.1 helix-turn-helix domain-containing protein [Corynebacterium poyangense]